MNLEVKTIEPKPGFLELSRHQFGSYNTQDIKSLSFQDGLGRSKRLYDKSCELALRDVVRLNRPNPKNR